MSNSTDNNSSKYHTIHNMILLSHDTNRGNNCFGTRIARYKCESFKKTAKSLMYRALNRSVYLGLVKTLTFFNHELASPSIMISLFSSNGPNIVTHGERQWEWRRSGRRDRNIDVLGTGVLISTSSMQKGRENCCSSNMPMENEEPLVQKTTLMLSLPRPPTQICFFSSNKGVWPYHLTQFNHYNINLI